MKIFGNFIQAECGMGIKKSCDSSSGSVFIGRLLGDGESALDYVDCDLIDCVEPMKYSTGLILEAIGKMGAEVYDAAKAYMQNNRVNGAVIWDLLVSGDYIEADNPCVIAAREMVIADGICTAEQFDAVLAASVISE